MAYSRVRCMRGPEKPTKDFLWADGRARAWLCDGHFKDWEYDVVSVHDINGEAPASFNQQDVAKAEKPKAKYRGLWYSADLTKTMSALTVRKPKDADGDGKTNEASSTGPLMPKRRKQVAKAAPRDTKKFGYRYHGGDKAKIEERANMMHPLRREDYMGRAESKMPAVNPAPEQGSLAAVGEIAKHLSGGKFDHDQKSHRPKGGRAGWKTALSSGDEAKIGRVSEERRRGAGVGAKAKAKPYQSIESQAVADDSGLHAQGFHSDAIKTFRQAQRLGIVSKPQHVLTMARAIANVDARLGNSEALPKDGSKVGVGQMGAAVHMLRGPLTARWMRQEVKDAEVELGKAQAKMKAALDAKKPYKKLQQEVEMAAHKLAAAEHGLKWQMDVVGEYHKLLGKGPKPKDTGPKLKLPEDAFAGVRASANSERTKQLIREAYANGELSRDDSRDGGNWRMGPYSGRTAAELINHPAYKGRKTVAEQRRELEHDKAGLRTQYRIALQQVPANLQQKREDIVRKLEEALAGIEG